MRVSPSVTVTKYYLDSILAVGNHRKFFLFNQPHQVYVDVMIGMCCLSALDHSIMLYCPPCMCFPSPDSHRPIIGVLSSSGWQHKSYMSNSPFQSFTTPL